MNFPAERFLLQHLQGGIIILFFLVSAFCSCISESHPEKITAKKEPGQKMTASAYGSNIILNGIYTGKNLYVQNPFSDLGGFCITSKPVVNGSVSTALIHSSAFEIRLSDYNLKNGDSVHIVITHDDNCLPKVLNPEAIGLKRDTVK
jgi:hypothetical protein